MGFFSCFLFPTKQHKTLIAEKWYLLWFINWFYYLNSSIFNRKRWEKCCDGFFPIRRLLIAPRCVCAIGRVKVGFSCDCLIRHWHWKHSNAQFQSEKYPLIRFRPPSGHSTVSYFDRNYSHVDRADLNFVTTLPTKILSTFLVLSFKKASSRLLFVAFDRFDLKRLMLDSSHSQIIDRNTHELVSYCQKMCQIYCVPFEINRLKKDWDIREGSLDYYLLYFGHFHLKFRFMWSSVIALSHSGSRLWPQANHQFEWKMKSNNEDRVQSTV